MTHDQHVVPQVYLKYFADGKTCYVIDGYGKISSKSIEGICYENDYYELRDSEGEIVYKNLFESGVYQKLETSYSNYLEDLFLALKTDNVKRFLKLEDNSLCLITWMVIMLLRNPLAFSMTPEIGRKMGIEWNDLQAHNNAILSITALENMSRKLYKTHKVVFLKNDTNTSFLTGNYPSVIMNDKRGKTRGYMPLSPEYYVLLIDKGDKELKEFSVSYAIKPIINHYNIALIRSTIHIETDVKHKYIISKDRKTLEYYQEYIQKHLSKKSQ